MAARMHTHGWDFYAPPQTVVYHLWSRGHRVSFRQKSTPIKEREEANATRRLKTLLGMDIPGDRKAPSGEGEEKHKGENQEGSGDSSCCSFLEFYSLGRERSLQSFEEQVGIDLKAGRLTSPEARNAGHPPGDFNDSLISGMEGMLGELRAQLSQAGAGGVFGHAIGGS
ncbi:unnamed protein product [Discosporangium mesarthrocarpum]